uniref:Protein-lysine N-methyltransferase SMYD4 n=1 Tax=Neogobius melanostomus TaxID=47308 RepID=A0A8C6WII6_9GOBI
MDLPCPQWQEHVAQKWAALDSDQRESFSSISEIDDVFKFAQSLITQDDLDFLQSLSTERCLQKSEDKASKSRERGNSSFKIKDYTLATLHYSQGICLAPRSSQQLSLCYANRSAALCHLQLYQESLDDIDLALTSGYPSHLLHKLQDRRALCLRHLSTDQEAKADHPSENRNAPDGDRRQAAGERFSLGICPQATVGFSLDKGRHLLVKERIAPGKVVLTDKPYSLVLIPGMDAAKGGDLFGTEHRFCHRCLSKTLHLIPCESCSYSRYCSEACQKEAWLEYHKWECCLGADLILMGVLAQLALRVTLKAGIKNIQMARLQSERKGPGDSNCGVASNYCHANVAALSHCSDSYLSVFHLTHHLSHHSARLRFLAAVTVATVYLKLGAARTGPLPPRSGETQEEAVDSEGCPEQWLMGSAVLRHMLQLRCNAQAITVLLFMNLCKSESGPATSSVQSSCEMRIATALFPTLSILNHSCSSNTSLSFTTGSSASPGPDLSKDPTGHANRGVTATVRAAKAIAPGQEILHCYGPHSSRMKTQERRRLLFEQYNFHCQCEACTLQQDQEEKDGAAENTNQHETKLQCAKCKEPGFICSHSKCSHYVSSSEMDHKLQEIKVNLERAVQLMERDKPGSLRLLTQTQVLCGLILSDAHPLQGELEDATARAFATMGDWGNAAVHLQRSVTAISSQFGEESIELGRQLFKLTQLHFNGSAALSVIPKVRRLLQRHCGPECDELQELRAMERCLSP